MDLRFMTIACESWLLAQERWLSYPHTKDGDGLLWDPSCYLSRRKFQACQLHVNPPNLSQLLHREGWYRATNWPEAQGAGLGLACRSCYRSCIAWNASAGNHWDGLRICSLADLSHVSWLPPDINWTGWSQLGTEKWNSWWRIAVSSCSVNLAATVALD